MCSEILLYRWEDIVFVVEDPCESCNFSTFIDFLQFYQFICFFIHRTSSNRNLAKTMLVDAKNTVKFNNIMEDYKPEILIIETLVMKKTTVLASFSTLGQGTAPNNTKVDK